MGSKTETDKQPHVAIIGAGITGISLAIGLHARKVKFTVYERAADFGEIGEGISFSPNAERAMRALDPGVHEALLKVTAPSDEQHFLWYDGQRDEPLFKLFIGNGGLKGCRRIDFLDQLVKLVPRENVVFGKYLESVVEDQDGNGMVSMGFRDGTVEKADVGKADKIPARISPDSTSDPSLTPNLELT